mmetsp:Transcript_41832/g.89255  ORF Transcript_41832/g.89255 Transcript_41832/m.89255 type:complete len:215 (+) Transcript_41832:840-1484(+)
MEARRDRGVPALVRGGGRSGRTCLGRQHLGHVVAGMRLCATQLPPEQTRDDKECTYEPPRQTAAQRRRWRHAEVGRPLGPWPREAGRRHQEEAEADTGVHRRQELRHRRYERRPQPHRPLAGEPDAAHSDHLQQGARELHQHSGARRESAESAQCMDAQAEGLLEAPERGSGERNSWQHERVYGEEALDGRPTQGEGERQQERDVDAGRGIRGG